MKEAPATAPKASSHFLRAQRSGSVNGTNLIFPLVRYNPAKGNGRKRCKKDNPELYKDFGDDKSTDHWLTIIGKGEDEKGRYFIYTDPGTSVKDTGTSSQNNRLYQKEDKHIWRDDTKYANSDGGAGKGSYTLVAVTLYDKHRGQSEFKVGSETFKRKQR